MVKNIQDFNHDPHNWNGNQFHVALLNAYLTHLLEEIAQLRATIQSLAPILKESQQMIELKIIAYANNYNVPKRTPHRFRTTNGTSNETKSAFKKVWNMLRSLLDIESTKKLEARKQIIDAFQTFYYDKNSGVDFRFIVHKTMNQSKRMERLMEKLCKSMMEIRDHVGSPENNSIDGMAYQLRVRRSQLLETKAQFDYVLKQVKTTKSLFRMILGHQCWEVRDTRL